MSGTSADGIDTALLRLAGDPRSPDWTLLAHRTDPFSEPLREEILQAVRAGSFSASRAARLHVRLGGSYASVLQRLALDSDVATHELDAIGLHGQTIFHESDGPWPVSLQIGSAAVVAEALGCDVIHDFRSRDIAAGGKGAPLVPFADAALLRSPDSGRVALNIGGIANLTWLPAGSGVDGVTGFDTGPGNMVMDGLLARGSSGSRRFDEDGELARSGSVVPEILDEWLAHPFFEKEPPRSTGREDFGAPFLDEAWRKWGESVPLPDLLATAARLTVETIGQGCERHLRGVGMIDEVIVSGGGVRNARLMELLSDRLAPARVTTSDEHGLPPDTKEAVAFALLAYAFKMGVPANVPAVTGADHPVILGSLVPGSVETGSGSDGNTYANRE
jgi:anhydro-N-acetylmuramic acid kinase